MAPKVRPCLSAIFVKKGGKIHILGTFTSIFTPLFWAFFTGFAKIGKSGRVLRKKYLGKFSKIEAINYKIILRFLLFEERNFSLFTEKCDLGRVSREFYLE